MILLISAVVFRKSSAVSVLSKALDNFVSFPSRKGLKEALYQASQLIGGGRMMRQIFKLWWKAWADYAYCVRVFKQSKDKCTTGGEMERQISSKMYDDLQYIHSYGVEKRDILNQMLLFSVENGLTANLRFITEMNKGQRWVRGKRFAKVFPGSGTSLLNLATKHKRTFSWLLTKFQFDEAQLKTDPKCNYIQSTINSI